jgi:AraC-like DNA-binding protein
VSLLIDTAVVPAVERVEFWSNASCNVYHPLQIRAEANARFWARMWRSELASIRVFRIAAATNTMSRTPSTIAAGDPECLHLSVQLRGRIQVTQQHRASVTAPGDIMSYETSRPVILRSDHAFEALVFSIPRAMLGEQATKICHQTAVRIPGGEGLPRLAVPFFQGVVEGLNDGSIQHHDANVAERVVDLVLGLYTDRRGSVEPRRLRSQTELLLHAKAFIEARLGDRHLGPEDIARASFISIRYLHKLFEAEGLSVCEWIRTTRLERCRRDLLDPALSDSTILEIASRWGLPSAPHFSRLFHAAYGCSPREYRRSAPAAISTYESGAADTRAGSSLRSCGM